MDKKNRLSTDYDDEDMDWLDDDDDYLDDGGILSSLLFGDKKKKKKTAKDNPKKDNEQLGRVQRARGEVKSGEECLVALHARNLLIYSWLYCICEE